MEIDWREVHDHYTKEELAKMVVSLSAKLKEMQYTIQMVYQSGYNHRSKNLEYYRKKGIKSNLPPAPDVPGGF